MMNFNKSWMPYVMPAEEGMRWLESKGIMFDACDTPIPLLGNEVNCGTPLGIGDELIEGYYYLPKSALGNNPLIDVPARGESMIDDYIEEGDILRVELGAIPHDGNVVIACIDNEYTAKVFFTDTNGRRWLCPRNKHYDCIHLTESMNVRIVGVVKNILKQAPQHSFGECMSYVEATQKRKQKNNSLLEHLRQAVCAGSHLFWAGAAWAEAYCVLRDYCKYEENVSEFERKASKMELPDSFEHCCSAGKVQRTISNHPYMRKPVKTWKDNGAADREVALADYLKEKLEDFLK